MHRTRPNQRCVYRIELQAPHPGLKRLARWAGASLETLLALDQLNALYHGCSEGAPSARQFLHNVLDGLHVRWRPSPDELARIPRSGPLVVVANHPYGALDGIALAAMLCEARDDVRVMATYMLGRAQPLHDLFFYVDPFQRPDAPFVNASPLRQAIRHLKDGGVLAVFPAGEVSSFNLRQREICDPVWNTTIAGIIRRTRSAALPVYFNGRNSILFQSVGLVHPRLRTALLARELFNQRGTRISARIGSAIPFKRIEHFADDSELTAYLRQRTHLLRHRSDGKPRADVAPAPLSARQQPIALPVDPQRLAADVAALPRPQVLVEADDMLVCHARAAQIPSLMLELGRLREITFRATGEGTGKSLDLDRFDDDYVQLLVWNRARSEIVGAYRLGPTDEILELRGKQGLYTSTLFDCRMELLQHITPALELGRSFIREEYQKSFSPLLLLWKGIGAYVSQNPRYRFLFGPVSISNTYQSVSKQLMVSFLKAHHCPPDLVDLVQARNPFRLARIAGWDRSAVRLIRDSDDVSDVVSDLEPESKGIPVLLRQYLKLGAKLLAFNVDPGFADCVDALMVCDLTKTDVRMIDRYMGKDGRVRFLQYHADRARPAERIRERVAEAP